MEPEITLQALVAAKAAADFSGSMARLTAATEGASAAAQRATEAAETYAVLHQRWKIEFCLNASDEEIAEADRLFGA